MFNKSKLALALTAGSILMVTATASNALPKLQSDVAVKSIGIEKSASHFWWPSEKEMKSEKPAKPMQKPPVVVKY